MAKKRKTSGHFAPVDKLPAGSRTEKLLKVLEFIGNGDGPVKYEEACEEAGVQYPADLMPAMTALEVAGVLKRYTYVESGGTRSKNAYAFVNEDNPTKAS